MLFPVRLHDAADRDTVLQRLLPVLAGARGERRAAYAEYDAGRGLLVNRWSTCEAGEGLDERWLELEPGQVHSLLVDDAGGDRPLRPADDLPVWVLRDLLPGLAPERYWVRVRAIAHEGALLGVLMVAEPRRWMLSPTSETPVQAAGDVLEMALVRARALEGGLPKTGVPAVHADSVLERLRESERQAADARREVEQSRATKEALERAHAGATELLMDAHVELDRRAARHQRQTRVLFLLRKLLEKQAVGIDPRELAVEIVRTVAEAFGGGRCSLLLAQETAEGAELRLGAAIGLPPAVSPDAVRVPLGRGISGRVADTRTAVVVRDPVEGDPHALGGDDWYTGPAFVSLPLCSRGRMLGVLNLTNFRAGTVDDSEVEQLRLISLCVALLVDHAGLGERIFSPAAVA
jgi:putative methionine-R-sulfoxide reductase with GAF domain